MAGKEGLENWDFIQGSLTFFLFRPLIYNFGGIFVFLLAFFVAWTLLVIDIKFVPRGSKLLRV